MQKTAQKKSPRPFSAFSVLLPAALALCLASCAASRGAGKNTAPVPVSPAERLFMTVVPFDAVVAAELARGGLDPARVADDFESELRYLLALRRQEEALDSASAVVRLRVEVRHLQPGAGNAGSFAAVHLVTYRGSNGADSAVSDLDWRPSARANVPAAHAARHMVRELSREVTARLSVRKKKRLASDLDYPPPLMLMK